MSKIKTRNLMFCLILLLSIGLRLVNLDKGYNSDETWLLKRTNLNIAAIIPSLTQGTSVYPPLSAFLLNFWAKLNKSELWIRLYFVFFGVALSVLVYLMGKLYIDEHFGLISFFLSAISPLLIWSSQFVRSYIDSAFWIILSFYFMLRLIKQGGLRRDSLGYVLFSVFALYSSYINIPILISQSIFVMFFYLSDLKFLRKWFFLQACIAVIFLPCLLLLFKQIKLATVINAQWSARGFNLWGINFAYPARSIAAMFGMDPDFLTAFPLAALNRIILFFFAGISFAAIASFLKSALNNLKRSISGNKLVYFFPLLSVLTMLIYGVLVEVAHFHFKAQFFLAQHVLFIFVISAAIYKFNGSKKINFIVLSIVLIVFLWRYPEAINPQFEIRKARNYLVNNIKENECLLLYKDAYIGGDILNTVALYDFADEKNCKGINESGLSQKALDKLNTVNHMCADIWFYRMYGNNEILGGNRLVMNWILQNGYVADSIQKFKRIDIIHYKRLDGK